MKNNLFLFFCFLIAGCSSKVSQPESAEIVPYNGSDGSSLSTFIRSIEVVKPDHQQSKATETDAVNRARLWGNEFFAFRRNKSEGEWV